MDRAYEGNETRQLALDLGFVPVVPPLSTRIEPWEYVLFHTAYNEMEGTKDADGKTVKGEAKSDHVREWLEDFSGLTDEQRAFLWGTVYTSEW